MEAPVEIRYSGVILGRVGEMPNAGEAAPFFLPMREPLPVGTVLRLRLEDRETPVRVVHTVESPDPDVAGMQVRTIGESEVVAFEFIPAPVPMLDTPKSESATSAVEPTTPVVEIDAQKSAPAEIVAVAAPETAIAETSVAQPATDEPALGSSTTVTETSPPASEPETVAAANPAGSVESTADSQAVVAVETTTFAASDTEAVPEAVPTAVGSSLTGALANAADSVATDSAAVASETAGDSSASSGADSTEDLPPARPISGSSGRRKTKRRK
jgi:hypothetical protein